MECLPSSTCEEEVRAFALAYTFARRGRLSSKDQIELERLKQGCGMQDVPNDWHLAPFPVKTPLGHHDTPHMRAIRKALYLGAAMVARKPLLPEEKDQVRRKYGVLGVDINMRPQNLGLVTPSAHIPEMRTPTPATTSISTPSISTGTGGNASSSPAEPSKHRDSVSPPKPSSSHTSKKIEETMTHLPTMKDLRDLLGEIWEKVRIEEPEGEKVVATAMPPQQAEQNKLPTEDKPVTSNAEPVTLADKGKNVEKKDDAAAESDWVIVGQDEDGPMEEGNHGDRKESSPRWRPFFSYLF